MQYLILFQTFICVPETRSLDTPGQLDNIQGYIDCQQPITDLYKFVGNIILLNRSTAPVTKALLAQNILLRGAKLKNTSYIYGKLYVKLYVLMGI